MAMTLGLRIRKLCGAVITAAFGILVALSLWPLYLAADHRGQLLAVT